MISKNWNHAWTTIGHSSVLWKGDDWGDWEDECLTFSESSDLGVWDTLDESYDPEKWCVIPQYIGLIGAYINQLNA